ncbi:sigma-54-dependent transcriptional regulator [Pedobacter heparinus]|uniref:Sigma-54 factor interaction domain-containing protein n=1 Tax=Pedobacter heparinus (strain ATCC 13125 / DSM 2366 / CIP 104194 / JCM 7457 / NBRC 12017 / NCIMB 9290 / NRRL B-14731 / HIM 762-3) TaxID=485917 RepID=C6XUT4_PEDHD|nr:sigma-54 dependent transcriptional regulator [Pedobacter heparinus]ACU05942.1 sigma-54 factor interaction domain-containing protein [Pedobacter heparinus DSM 2366]
MAKILIIEDDSTFSQVLEGFFTKQGHEPQVVNNVKKAFKITDEQSFDLLLIDYRLPDGTGLDILSHVLEKGLLQPVIIMTSFNDVRTAVKSIQLGAFDYITKPVNPDELMMIIKNALGKKENSRNSAVEHADAIKGKSAIADKLYEHINLVAPTDMSVIIQGESGTGKEYAARALHAQSKRRDKPFVAIDCGALSKDLAASELFGHTKGAFTGALNDKKGQFEAANSGTLFLDEVGNLSYEVQVKMLRALQERIIQPLGSTKTIKVDVRIITATNDDLKTSVANGLFREDLYHRLNEFKIQLPALRDRGKDIELFISHFIKLSNSELDRNVQSISPQAKELLLRYDWPGNLRELKNVIKRMVLLTPGETAEVDALPEEMIISINHSPRPSTSDLKVINELNEKALITETLVKVKYNKSKAAKLLNIDRKTLYSKMERYGIE